MALILGGERPRQQLRASLMYSRQMRNLLRDSISLAQLNRFNFCLFLLVFVDVNRNRSDFFMLKLLDDFSDRFLCD